MFWTSVDRFKKSIYIFWMDIFCDLFLNTYCSNYFWRNLFWSSFVMFTIDADKTRCWWGYLYIIPRRVKYPQHSLKDGDITRRLGDFHPSGKINVICSLKVQRERVLNAFIINSNSITLGLTSWFVMFEPCTDVC